MPETKIFFNNSSLGMQMFSRGQGTSSSSSARAKGNKMIIDHYDEGHHTTDKIHVYELEQLRQSKLFQDAMEVSTEQLVALWHTKKSKNGKLIKYATNDELALVFSTSNGDVEEHFFRSKYRFRKLDYFKECNFVQFLEQRNSSVAELRATPGMDENRIRLLVNNLDSFKTLLDINYSLEQIAQIKPSIIESRYPKQLSKALKYATMEQLLGQSHTPPVAPLVKTLYPISFADVGLGKLTQFGTFGDEIIRHASSSEQLNLTYSKKYFMIETHPSKWTARLEVLTEERKQALDSKILELQPEKMLFEWYHLEEKNAAGTMEQIIYCPEVNWVISEKKDSAFPETSELLETSFNSLPFYIERTFANLLRKHGSSFEALRSIPGMTEFKIFTMCLNQRGVSKLLGQGIQLEDFARIRGRRLAYVLSKLSCNFDVECAMEYVDVRELLGLAQQSLSAVQFFQPALSSDSIPKTSAPSPS